MRTACDEGFRHALTWLNVGTIDYDEDVRTKNGQVCNKDVK